MIPSVRAPEAAAGSDARATPEPEIGLRPGYEPQASKPVAAGSSVLAPRTIRFPDEVALEERMDYGSI